MGISHGRDWTCMLLLMILQVFSRPAGYHRGSVAGDSSDDCNSYVTMRYSDGSYSAPTGRSPMFNGPVSQVIQSVTSSRCVARAPGCAVCHLWAALGRDPEVAFRGSCGCGILSCR